MIVGSGRPEVVARFSYAFLAIACSLAILWSFSVVVSDDDSHSDAAGRSSATPRADENDPELASMTRSKSAQTRDFADPSASVTLKGYWQSRSHGLREPSPTAPVGLPAQAGGSLRADVESARANFNAVLDELDGVIVDDLDLSREARAEYHGRLTRAYAVLTQTDDAALIERAYSDMQLRVRQLELFDHEAQPEKIHSPQRRTVWSALKARR